MRDTANALRLVEYQYPLLHLRDPVPDIRRGSGFPVVFPWAVVFLQEKAVNGNEIPFYAMMLFLAMLFFAVIYGWRKGVLDWQK